MTADHHACYSGNVPKSGLMRMKLLRMMSGTSDISKVLLSCIIGSCVYAVLMQSEYLQGYSLTKARHQENHSKLKAPLRRHDKTSMLSIMRTRGLLYDERKLPPTLDETTNSTNHYLLMDTLSIGTYQNIGLLEAQSRTWGSHRSIRHFFAATEVDDADPKCFKTLNKATIDQIVNTCVNEQPLAKGDMKLQYQKFTQGTRTNGIPSSGWICAQQRFAVAVETLGRFYRREMAAVPQYTLPDFLLMQDDDTYYNMVRIQDFLRDKDPNVPLAEAPCLIQHSKQRTFSFPWGGTIV